MDYLRTMWIIREMLEVSQLQLLSERILRASQIEKSAERSRSEVKNDEECFYVTLGALQSS